MPSKEKSQIAALPVIKGPDGRLRVMIVTSRDTGRWIIPKGWTMKGKSDWEAAAQEAFEEAGVEGDISRKSIGSFNYDKQLDGDDFISCKVDVYRLDVTRWVSNWPEGDERERLWCFPDEAAERLQEPELKDIVRSLAKSKRDKDKAEAASA
ncbi:MAG: NUDIX hydrolase [Tepidamorphaceae bacterium]